MKKLIILGIACLAMYQIGHAQTSSDIYMICSSSSSEPDEGVCRGEDHEDDNDPLYTHRPIFFTMLSKSKNIEINFEHFNYNPTELRKHRPPKTDDYMKIVIKPKSFYDTIVLTNPIDMERELDALQTKEESWTWARNFRGKCIYLYDKNDPMNRGDEGDGTTIRLIEVRVGATNRPISIIVYED